MTETYTIQVDDTRDHGQVESIICEICKRQSYCPTDVMMKYCANCDLMHETGQPRTNIDILQARQLSRLRQQHIDALEQEIKVAECNWQRDGF